MDIREQQPQQQNDKKQTVKEVDKQNTITLYSAIRRQKTERLWKLLDLSREGRPCVRCGTSSSAGVEAPEHKTLSQD